MCELIDDFGLVHFGTLDIGSRESVGAVLRSADKAIGYIGGGGEDVRERGVHSLDYEGDESGAVQERYMRETDLSELLGPGAGGAGDS